MLALKFIQNHYSSAVELIVRWINDCPLALFLSVSNAHDHISQKKYEEKNNNKWFGLRRNWCQKMTIQCWSDIFTRK